MKRIFIFLILISLTVAARADFVIQQKMESAMQNGDMTIKFKGNLVRVDMATGAAGDVSTILDLNTGDSTVLMHQQKMAMKMPVDQLKQMMEQMKNQNGTNTAPPKLVDTGKTEMVSGYDSEVYTWTNNRDSGGTVWMAKKYPDYAKIKAQLDKLEKSPASQLSKGITPDMSQLPGMVMKSKMEVQGQQATSTFVSAKEEPVDASIFTIPADYQPMSVPGMPDKPAAAAPPQ